MDHEIFNTIAKLIGDMNNWSYIEDDHTIKLFNQEIYVRSDASQSVYVHLDDKIYHMDYDVPSNQKVWNAYMSLKNHYIEKDYKNEIELLDNLNDKIKSY